MTWSGGRAIRRVEVSVDGGRTWADAVLRGPALKREFTRFDVMDADSLPQVVMPNKDRNTVPPDDWQPGGPQPWTTSPDVLRQNVRVRVVHLAGWAELHRHAARELAEPGFGVRVVSEPAGDHALVVVAPRRNELPLA